MNKNNKQWYKKWWGILIILCTWPIVVLWLIWKKTAWTNSIKTGATASLIIILSVFSAAGSKSTNQPLVPVVPATQVTPVAPQPVEKVETKVKAPEPVATPTPAPTTTTPKTVAPSVSPAPTPAPVSSTVYYANCTAVRAAGADPIYEGQPGYRSALDRDNDGIACE